MPHLYIHDQRSRWGSALHETARGRGWQAVHVNAADQIRVTADAIGFVRPHSHPRMLQQDKKLAREMRAHIQLVQDHAQIEVYDNKRAQYRRWAKWMPETWVFESLDEALDAVQELPLPIMSKADVGASSRNVRYLDDRRQLEQHIRDIFSAGVKVAHCSAPHEHYSLQRDYVLLQRFIPHAVTYRVNAVGDARAIFFRYCYSDRPMAQTGNVEPAYSVDRESESLLRYANEVFLDIGTKWCALDILKDGDSWRLLETSLCWPWPSPGDCNAGMFFDAETFQPLGRRWIDMFDVMLDEIQEGAWDA